MTATRFTVGPAGAADVPALVTLLGELFSIEQDFTPDPERQRAGLGQLLADPDRAAVLVARDGAAQVIAMVTAQLVVSTAEGAPSAWIEDMVVAKAHRRGGVGRALIDAALAWARQKGATRAQLLVDLDNVPALACYERLGWAATRLAARRVTLSRPG
ncbi:MAG: GNAT family N-acetyltransferase [Pseudomonadota bacterium]